VVRSGQHLLFTRRRRSTRSKDAKTVDGFVCGLSGAKVFCRLNVWM